MRKSKASANPLTRTNIDLPDRPGPAQTGKERVCRGYPRASHRRVTRALSIVVASEEATGVKALRLLVESGQRVRAVLTSTTVAHSQATPNPVAAAAEEAGLEVLPARNVADPTFARWIVDERVDLLLNIHSLVVAHAAVVAAPRAGSFNLHPGPLPEYAGLNTPSWAIYNGEREHAATWHWMEAGIDTGLIAYRIPVPIEERDTALSLSVKCATKGLEQLPVLLEAVAEGSVPAIPQDLDRRRYYSRAIPQDGKIDWRRPAQEIVRFVRACDYGPFPSPWGHPVARLGGVELELRRTQPTGRPCNKKPGAVAERIGEAVVVATGDEFLRLDRVRIDGGIVAAAEAIPPGSLLEDG
jgi:methionyl-tRNA formyltransferase